nr:3702_t:CDS:2 [Entrophospora candida]
MSISSAEDRRSFDPSLFGSKPDFLIRTTNTNYVELLLAEIKPTKVSIKLFSNDLVKLGKEMKSSIDKIIDEGLLDVSVYGIHGAEICKCYIMDLKSEGIYRMMVLGKFIIPRDPTSWATVINCFQILITLKGLVYESANNYYDTSRRILYENSEKTTYQQKFKRHGFHSPLKLMVNVADITMYNCGVELPQIVIIISSPRHVSDKNTKMTGNKSLARDQDYTYGDFNDESEE